MKNWVITVSGRPMEGVLTELVSAGFIVDQVLGETGIITGSSDDVSGLRGISGIADISEDTEISIAPPDSTIQ